MSDETMKGCGLKGHLWKCLLKFDSQVAQTNRTRREAAMWWYWNIHLFLCLNRVYFFLKKFWVHSKIGQSTERGHVPPALLLLLSPSTRSLPPTQVFRVSLSPTILSTFWVLVTIDESTWTHHDHQSPEFTLGFTPGVAQSMGFDKCISPWMYHTE